MHSGYAEERGPILKNASSEKMSFLLRQAIEIPFFVIFWQLSFSMAAAINNYLYVALQGLPDVVNAYFRTGIILIFTGAVLLTLGRYLVFEIINKEVPYITPREKGKFVFITFTRFKLGVFLVVCGTILFLNRPTFEIVLFSPLDHLKLLALWLFTDLFFYAVHGAMHFRWLFKTFHYLHHKVVSRPNVYVDCDRFTYIDAIGHFAEYVVAFWLMNLVIPMSNEIWLLGLMQWLVIGQFQHGGKEIYMNQLPGLEIVRRLCGVKHSFCQQHDVHHTTVHYNFCMTGIYDKLFGTAAKLPPKKASEPV